MRWIKVASWLLCVLCCGVVDAHPGHEGEARPQQFFFDEGVGELKALLSSDVGLHVSQGEGWYQICEDLFGGDVRSFALAGAASGDPRRRAWLVGSFGRSLPDRSPRAGFFRSVDGGCSWSEPEGALKGRWVSAISTRRERPEEVLAASADLTGGNGVALSEDAGASWSWTGLRGVSGPVEVLLRAPSDGARVYASWRRGAWRSEDGGRSWAPILGEMVVAPVEELRLLAVDPQDPGLVYFSRFGLKGRSLWVSRDGGESGVELLAPSQKDFASAALSAGPGGARTLLVATGRGSIYRSSDRGARWEEGPLEAQVGVLAASSDQRGEVVALLPRVQQGEGRWAGKALGRWEEGSLRPWFSYGETRGLWACPAGSDVARVCPALDWASVGRGEVVRKKKPTEPVQAVSAPVVVEGPVVAEGPVAEAASEGAGGGRWVWLGLGLLGVVVAVLLWRRSGRGPGG
jgi:hypothetical protein